MYIPYKIAGLCYKKYISEELSGMDNFSLIQVPESELIAHPYSWEY